MKAFYPEKLAQPSNVINLANYFEKEEENEQAQIEEQEELFEGDVSDEDTNKDPVTPYGPGVLSYFDLYYELMKVFAIMTLLAIPMIAIYYSMSGMSYLEGEQSRV